MLHATRATKGVQCARRLADRSEWRQSQCSNMKGSAGQRWRMACDLPATALALLTCCLSYLHITMADSKQRTKTHTDTRSFGMFQSNKYSGRCSLVCFNQVKIIFLLCTAGTTKKVQISWNSCSIPAIQRKRWAWHTNKLYANQYISSFYLMKLWWNSCSSGSINLVGFGFILNYQNKTTSTWYSNFSGSTWTF